MSEPGVRPGGLTALAVINFVWAAFQLAIGAGTVTSPFYMPVLAAQAEKEAAAETRPEKQKDATDAAKQMREASDHVQLHKNLVMLDGGVKLFLALLLILAGIGYLKLRRFLGRTLGVVFAILAVLWGMRRPPLHPEETGDAPGIFSLIGFIYPAITLFALLVTFRDDFINP